MTITALINELKEQEQDFELYPSTPEMVKTIWANCDDGTWLDIGAGTCNFKKYFNQFSDKFNTIYDNQMKLHNASYNCYTGKYEIEAPKGKKTKKLTIDKFGIALELGDEYFEKLQNINVNADGEKYEAKIISLAEGNILLVINKDYFEDIKEND